MTQVFGFLLVVIGVVAWLGLGFRGPDPYSLTYDSRPDTPLVAGLAMLTTVGILMFCGILV